MSEEPEFAIGVPGLEPERQHIQWDVMVAHLLIALVSFLGPLLLYINCRPRGCQGQLTACKSNCKNLATALEMYSSDNGGKYPTDLRLLIEGNYLKLIPTCPSAGYATYTDYRYSQKPDSFSFSCVGNNHARHYQGFSTSSDNFPQYNAEFGLLDHP